MSTISQQSQKIVVLSSSHLCTRRHRRHHPLLETMSNNTIAARRNQQYRVLACHRADVNSVHSLSLPLLCAIVSSWTIVVGGTRVGMLLSFNLFYSDANAMLRPKGDIAKNLLLFGTQFADKPRAYRHYR